jgi:hypothetical protein
MLPIEHNPSRRVYREILAWWVFVLRILRVFELQVD